MAEDGGKRSHFKMFLALALIVGIVGLLAYGNRGDNVVSSVIGRFSSVGGIGGEPFNIVLSTDSTVLYGNSFDLAGSDITVSGICNSLKIGSLTVAKDNTRCSIQASGYTGKFEYTPFGSIVVSGQAPSVKIDAYTYTAGNAVSIEAEVIPTGFHATGLIKSKISTVAPSGSISKFSGGELKGVSYLSKTPLDISNLNADAELKDGVLTLTGTATAVKSTEFSW
ncbi:MAG: hypothetical protein HYT70_01715 [Candidatus Aenigmarchaeota archaeon]|nr:hypothetical protein [Candidatus Aenigmarchaeota archaeon]